MTLRDYWRSTWWIAALIVLSLLSAAAIAGGTSPYVHPDEALHVNAFCYFEAAWWPPALNDDHLLYSAYGWSRVYSGEIVYLVYGKLMAMLEGVGLSGSRSPGLAQMSNASNRVYLPYVSGPAWCVKPVAGYRYISVALYALTLAGLYWAGRKQRLASVLALTMMATPQITYIYSYANSDAWGISMSLALLIFVILSAPMRLTSWWKMAGIGLLSGLVLLSKQPFWLILPFACAPLLVDGVLLWRRLRFASFARVAGPLFLAVVVVLLVAGPARAIYPLTQGDFGAKEVQMRESRAEASYRPSVPTAPGLSSASRGVDFQQIWGSTWWWSTSGRSSYAAFAHMTVWLPDWLYTAVLGIVMLYVTATVLVAGTRWHAIDAWLRVQLVLAPCTIMLAIGASLWNSWVSDVQPQGRYLFAGLAPLAVLMGGAMAVEPRWLQKVRYVGWLMLVVTALAVLWMYVTWNPVFG
ncbi:MAG: DUF2142 domain-containing protein [Anaerolineales bacterium]|nr:DUF2142 domain-containing protein [Anaerolineales bacterium]